MPGLALVPGVIAFAGGLPIMTADNVQIGAIGVSGASTGDQDEMCTQQASMPSRISSNSGRRAANLASVSGTTGACPLTARPFKRRTP